MRQSASWSNCPSIQVTRRPRRATSRAAKWTGGCQQVLGLRLLVAMRRRSLRRAAGLAMPPVVWLLRWDDPRNDMFKRRVALAHAIANRAAARKHKPYWRRHWTTMIAKRKPARWYGFPARLCGGIVRKALAQGSDPAGRVTRDHALAEAAALLSGASAEVQRLNVTRELAGWISAARASSSP